MKRILLASTIAASVLAYACSSTTDDKNEATTNPDITPPTEETDAGGGGGGGGEGGTGGEGGVQPGGEDPSGNPILLGAARTVRSFTPAGGSPHFVDGPAWSTSKNMLFVNLPFAQNASGGKGILTQFKIDGTNYTEVRAGDKIMFGAVGNTVDKDGNIFSAELKSITRTGASGAPEIVATGWSTGVEGAPITPFDAPNDLVVLDDGTIFVTDPGYGVDPRPQQGRLLKIKSGDAFATVVGSYDFNPSPNGIALSKDQKSLFVGFTSPGEGTLPFVRKYTIKEDRTLEDNGKYLETPVGSDPDGLAMDDDGNLYIAMKGGIGVYKATGATGVAYGDPAKVPQTKVEGDPTGVAFGGPDRKSLFVTTTNGKALELKTKVPGLLH